jgi:hypothetical protein
MFVPRMRLCLISLLITPITSAAHFLPYSAQYGGQSRRADANRVACPAAELRVVDCSLNAMRVLGKAISLHTHCSLPDTILTAGTSIFAYFN